MSVLGKAKTGMPRSEAWNRQNRKALARASVRSSAYDALLDSLKKAGAGEGRIVGYHRPGSMNRANQR